MLRLSECRYLVQLRVVSANTSSTINGNMLTMKRIMVLSGCRNYKASRHPLMKSHSTIVFHRGCFLRQPAKMLRSLLFSSIILSLVSLVPALDPNTVIDANGISLFDKIEEIERQLLQPATLNSLVLPCSLNAQANPNEGQQTSAEWVRIVFHDCITKGIAGPGLGYVTVLFLL